MFVEPARTAACSLASVQLGEEFSRVVSSTGFHVGDAFAIHLSDVAPGIEP